MKGSARNRSTSETLVLAAPLWILGLLRRKLMQGALGVALVSALLVLGTPSSALGQATYDGCVDFRGRAVLSIHDDNIGDVAMARVVNGEPVVFYNVRVLAWLPAKTRLFWYAHECAHHVLAHLARMNLDMEQEADCWGIRELVRRRIVADVDITRIQSSLSYSPGDSWHFPGPIRAINLRRCLGGSRRSPPDMGRSCCTRSGRCGPFWNQPAQPIGAPCSCEYGNPYASGAVCN